MNKIHHFIEMLEFIRVSILQDFMKCGSNASPIDYFKHSTTNQATPIPYISLDLFYRKSNVVEYCFFDAKKIRRSAYYDNWHCCHVFGIFIFEIRRKKEYFRKTTAPYRNKHGSN